MVMCSARVRTNSKEQNEFRECNDLTTIQPFGVFLIVFFAWCAPLHILAATPPGPFISTHSDPWLPNFAHPQHAAGPILRSAGSGLWSDPDTWGGTLPGTDDVVVIEHDVTLDLVVEVHDLVVYPGGRLTFAYDVETRLWVGTLEVLAGGASILGTAADPIQPGVRAEIVFVDRAIDPDVDPAQYGNGLLVFGEIRMHGYAKNRTWFRLAHEVSAGDSQLVVDLAGAGVSAIEGWEPGDRIVLPDSRQVPPSWIKGFNPFNREMHWEEAIIDRIDGDRIILRSPVRHAHRGARNADDELELLPHVALLTRNVVLRSENSNGVRGHTLYGMRADVKIKYAEFRHLGRTRNFDELNSTIFDENGEPSDQVLLPVRINREYVCDGRGEPITVRGQLRCLARRNIGTNQIARYSVHTHHLIGPGEPR